MLKILTLNDNTFSANTIRDWGDSQHLFSMKTKAPGLIFRIVKGKKKESN